MQTPSNSQGECKQRDGIWHERNVLLDPHVHCVAFRPLEPSGLHGQGDALTALHQVGKQPPSKAQEHLHYTSNTIRL